MALSMGWKVNDERDGAWKDDPAFQGVTPVALASWEQDGAMAHLKPFETNGKATVIKWRALESDESAHADRYRFLSSRKRYLLECFALVARIQGMPDEGTAPDGTKVDSLALDGAGNVRLSRAVMNFLDYRYPGLIEFYGEKIRSATFPSEAVKKASSPPSTGTQSSEADGTSRSTEGEQLEKAPAA